MGEYLSDYISEAAMLEQFAEAAIEASYAALQLARKIRDENKIYRSRELLVDDLAGCLADVRLGIECLDHIKTVDYISIAKKYKVSLEMMQKRIEEENLDG